VSPQAILLCDAEPMPDTPLLTPPRILLGIKGSVVIFPYRY